MFLPTTHVVLYNLNTGNYRIVLWEDREILAIVVMVLFFLIQSAYPVPVYSFGEMDLYDQISSPEGSKLHTFQVYFTRIVGFAPPLFKGRGFFNYSLGLLPYRRPIDTVGMFF